MLNRSALKLGLLSAALLVFFLAALCSGSVAIPLRGVWAALLGSKDASPEWIQILWLFRLPRALTALLAGAGLAAAGLQMQTLFRNPLADPFVLGISSGASLGVALLVLFLGGSAGGALAARFPLLSNLSLVAASGLGAAAVFALILLAARRVRGNLTLLILGLFLSYAVSALVSVMMAFSQDWRLKIFVAWTFGSFSGVTWDQMKVLAPAVLVGLGLALANLKSLNALLLGEETASSLGLKVRRARFNVLLSSSLLAAAVTSFCGVIGFIGLAAPHVARGLLKTSDHRLLLPACLLTGALLALLADLACQLPGAASGLPLNAVTSLLGAPVAAWVILRRRHFFGDSR